MNTTGKIQNKGQVTIPTAVRRQAGLSKGDLVKFTFRRGQIVITPTLVIDRSNSPPQTTITPQPSAKSSMPASPKLRKAPSTGLSTPLTR